jgi:O-antigen ligase
MWLDLGLLGLLTLLSGFAFAAKRAWVALRAGITLEGVWATSFLVVLLLLDMVESPLYQNMLFWTVFVAVAAMIPVKSQEIAFLSEVSRPSM